MSADVMAGPTISEPGLYPDVSAEEYNADPVVGGSLRSSSARLLAEDGGAAKFRDREDNPTEDEGSDALDFGTLAHWKVLGDHNERIVLVQGDDWRGIRGEARREARTEGKVAVLPKHLAQVDAMVAALERHELATQLLRAARHEAPEQTVVWQDNASGVWCRARFDTFHQATADSRLTIVDYKTAADASDDGFQGASQNHGYHQQDDWYRAGARAVGMDEDPLFLFVVQEKRSPFLVNVINLDSIFKTIGRNLNRGALNLYAQCQATGEWPGFNPKISTIGPSVWYARKHDEDGES